MVVVLKLYYNTVKIFLLVLCIETLHISMDEKDYKDLTHFLNSDSRSMQWPSGFITKDQKS